MDPIIIVGILLGIPTIGFAVRLVVKPMTDAYVRSRELKAGVPDDSRALRQQAERVAQLEAELASIRDEVARLSAVESFYAQLQAPGSPSVPSRG